MILPLGCDTIQTDKSESDIVLFSEMWSNGYAVPFEGDFDERSNYVNNTIIKANDVSEQIVIADFNMDEIRGYRKKKCF